MSLTVRDAGEPSPTRVDQREQGSDEAADIELRLATLADEMSCLIETGPRGERDTLRAYAVSLLRDRGCSDEWDNDPGVTPDVGEQDVEATRSSSHAATLVSYGFLLLPASAVLFLVFPPVGGMLFVAGGAMMCVGFMAALIQRGTFPRWIRR